MARVKAVRVSSLTLVAIVALVVVAIVTLEIVHSANTVVLVTALVGLLLKIEQASQQSSQAAVTAATAAASADQKLDRLTNGELDARLLRAAERANVPLASQIAALRRELAELGTRTESLEDRIGTLASCDLRSDPPPA